MSVAARTVLLTRRVAFASGHRYWKAGIEADENRRIYGHWASPYNHGHNYLLDVTIAGRADETDGMVVNIKTLDARLQHEVVARFDQKSINDEIAELEDVTPTLENLVMHFRRSLADTGWMELDGRRVHLVGLRLEESPTMWANWNEESMKLTLTRSYEFCASHRLHAPALSDSENAELYGKCNHPAGHGHNYTVEVSVAGKPDPVTGMMVDLEELDKTVDAEVVERYDHKNLDVDLPEFHGRVSTTEALTTAIFERLAPKLPGLTGVKVWETGRSSFEVRAE